MIEKELGPGSEGDAYRYTKKVLLALPNVSKLRRIYSEVAASRNLSSWTRACYQELRTQFFKDGQCKIKFAPGAARIAFGELQMGTGDEEFRQLADLRDFLRIISIAHFTEFTRHIGQDGKLFTYNDLMERFGNTVTANWTELQHELCHMTYGPRRYKVIWLDSFETASKYADYTKPHTWCHLSSQGMFEMYSTYRDTNSVGWGLNAVKLYLAVLPGFESMTEDDPLYGESMLGIDIGLDGRLIHVNNRWNHAHDNIDERKGDNKYSEKELSQLLGGPFYKICPPLSKRDIRRMELCQHNQIKRNNRRVEACMRELSTRIWSICGKKRTVSVAKLVDARDSMEYDVKRIGGFEFISEPVGFLPIPDVTPGYNRNPVIFQSANAQESEDTEEEINQDDEITVPDNTGNGHGAIGIDNGVIRGRVFTGTITVSNLANWSYSPLVKYVPKKDSARKSALFCVEDVNIQHIGGLGLCDAESNYASRCELYRDRCRKLLKDTPSRPNSSEVHAVVRMEIQDEVHRIVSDNMIEWIDDDGCCEAELNTPIGFSCPIDTLKSLPNSRVHRCPTLKIYTMDDMDVITYRGGMARAAIPDGWRMMELGEFIGIMIKSGAKLEFDSSSNCITDSLTQQSNALMEQMPVDLDAIDSLAEMKTYLMNACTFTKTARHGDGSIDGDDSIGELNGMDAPPCTDGNHDMVFRRPPDKLRVSMPRLRCSEIGDSLPFIKSVRNIASAEILLSLGDIGDFMSDEERNAFVQAFCANSLRKFYFHNIDYVNGNAYVDIVANADNPAWAGKMDDGHAYARVMFHSDGTASFDIISGKDMRDKHFVILASRKK